MNIIQISVLIFGSLAIWLVYSQNTLIARWAPVFGLVSQPFFLIATYQAQQWGMFILAVFFTVSWIRGIYRCWFQKYQDKYVLPQAFTVGSQTFRAGESMYRVQAAVHDLHSRFVGYRRSVEKLVKEQGGF